MKVAIIGNGNVGMATFRELQNLNEINELVLVGRNLSKIKAEIDDYRDSAVIRPYITPVLSSGGYEQTKGADIIIYSSGAAQKPEQSRLDLVSENIAVTKAVFSEINKYNKDAIIIVQSNPVDILTYAIRNITGRPRNKVIGTGTLLDTSRCIKYISELLDVSTSSINMFVIGEHGDSSVTLLSSLRLLGMSLDEYLSDEIGTEISVKSERIANSVRETAANLIKVKGFTAYGVAAAAARLVFEIVHNTNSILPVSAVLEGEYGVNDIAISVPCTINRNGIGKIRCMKMSDDEADAFKKSVAVLKGVAADAGLYD